MNLSGIGYDRCPMEPNALYYTLSTIAQTLAGALAVLVAVVLFKLAALASAIAPGRQRQDHAEALLEGSWGSVDH